MSERCVEGENCQEKPIWFPFTDPRKGVCFKHYGENHLGEIVFPPMKQAKKELA